MLKGLSNIGALMKQAQQIGGQIQGLGEELKQRRATGSAGGGMVEIEINGVLEVLHCKIEPELFAQGDREMIEDLIASAMNQAVAKGKQLHTEAMQQLTGGLELPGLQDALSKLTGSGPIDTESTDTETTDTESTDPPA